MTNAAAFLNSLGKRLASMSLYAAGHPSRDRAMDQVLEDMSMLLRENAFPAFSFLDGDVIYENSVMSELRQWEWSVRLAGVGVERLEISPGTSRADLESFLEEIHAAHPSRKWRASRASSSAKWASRACPMSKRSPSPPPPCG